jgi:hypothetical protein
MLISRMSGRSRPAAAGASADVTSAAQPASHSNPGRNSAAPAVVRQAGHRAVENEKSLNDDLTVFWKLAL